MMVEILCPRAERDADGDIICTAIARPILCLMWDCELWRGGYSLGKVPRKIRQSLHVIVPLHLYVQGV